MSEQCKYDEQVLDYLYEELAPSERAAFAEHLAGCESCRREIASLSGVRAHVAELPKPELSAESAAKMKAQLMEAAIAATQQTKHSVGGGKIVPFPSGRVRRILTHPATAALTVAAAALFLVVFSPKAPVAPVSDSPAPAVVAGAEAPAATTQVPVVDSVEESKPSAAKGTAAAPGLSAGVAASEGGSPIAALPSAPPTKTGFFDGRTLEAPSRSRSSAPAFGEGSAASGRPMAPATESKAVVAKLDPVRKEQASQGPSVAAKPMMLANNLPSAPQQVTPSTRAAMEQPASPQRFAPPPPPSAEPEVVAQAAPSATQAAPSAATASAYPSRSQVASRDDDSATGDVVEKSKQLQQKRTLDELERAELAQAPNQGYGRRYTATEGAGNVANTGQALAGVSKDSQQADEDQASNVGKASSAADKVPGDRSGLGTIYEQIRSGRCSEAAELIQKLERTSAGQPGLSELSATWQRECGARNLLPNAKPMPIEQQNLQMPPKKAMPSASQPVERMGKMPMEKMSLDAPSQNNFEAKRSLRKPAPIQNQNRAPAKAKKSAADAAY